MSAYLLLASELYSLPVLRPVAAAALAAGHRVGWLCDAAVAARLRADEPRIASRAALRAFAADATFATVHRIPAQLPGKQVQLFHGLNIDKRNDDGRGHFRIRGLFDLYCTHGPATTPRFAEQARAHGDFAVAETGWPKLDPLFSPSPAAEALRAAAAGRPVAMVASTFTESLSAAPALLSVLPELIARGDRYWLLTLHPKCPPTLFEAYRALAGTHARFLEAPDLLDMLRATDVLVCDTSSVIEECLLLDKPVVTLRTRRPRPALLDVQAPEDVDAAIDLALSRPPALMRAIGEYIAQIHPARDGKSAQRVIEATERLLAGGYGPLRPRRRGWWRRWQGRETMRVLLPE
ncbi:UDP-N-acetylglucosamine 2-epimerase [Luteimonas aquatica]|uniref:UDP-N-acetylglucosamine 2-epimerase n=1 Tax=Luteimonas aquatica TaxID=450364 RepID=UPI001F5758E7|nr:UDP-N-acetylglucosamine 2-epimerase [Luteimonas aquatica]